MILVLEFALFGYNHVKLSRCCTNATIGQQYLLFLHRNYVLNTHLAHAMAISDPVLFFAGCCGNVAFSSVYIWDHIG